MINSIYPDLLNMWAVDSNQSFSSMFSTRLMTYMPSYYQDSKFLIDYLNVIGEEFDIFDILLQGYHVREISRLVNNEEGWGFEKLVAQRFAITANHYLKKWADLANIPERVPRNYLKTKEMLRVIFEHNETISPDDLKDMITNLSDIPRSNIGIVEDFTNYSVIVGISFDEDTDFEPFIQEKIQKTLPAHLNATINFFVCQLNDPVPCELGDANAILLGGQ